MGRHGKIDSEFHTDQEYIYFIESLELPFGYYKHSDKMTIAHSLGGRYKKSQANITLCEFFSFTTLLPS